MLPTTLEWVKKAEGDYDVIFLLLRSRKQSRHDTICFPCQQCVEKYLKGRLIEAQLAFPKTHDLIPVLDMALPIEPLWTVFSVAFANLTKWAVMPRYPGTTATPVESREAVKVCRRFRRIARTSLGL